MIEMVFVKSIINLAIFLEYSDDSTIDEDGAVAAMEQLAADLSDLSAVEKLGISGVFKDFSSSYGDKRDFVFGLPESLGLVD